MSHEPEGSTREYPSLPNSPMEPGLYTAPAVQIDVAAMSHQGRVRLNNEDHYLMARTGRGIDILGSNLPAGALPDRIEEHGYALAVADGLGGMAAGEYASRLALQTGVARALATAQWTFRIDKRSAPELMRRMRSYFHAVDDMLLDHVQADRSLAGMATTLTLVYTIGADGFVAHAGDSRAYLFRAAKLQRLTTDHTMAQALADAGQIPPDAVSTHSRRNVLTNFVGGPTGGLNPEVNAFRLQDGDTLLVCTDGLTEMVDEPTIARLLTERPTADDACRALVAEALERGGRDNVTAIVARYRIPFDPGPSWESDWDPESTVDY